MMPLPGTAAMDAIAVSIGAVGGALARYHIGKVSYEYIVKDPNRLGYLTGWHVAGINISGSFILGMLAGVPTGTTSTTTPISARTQLMVGVGFCGSFTTYSTYSMDLVTMANEGRLAKAFSYFAVNNVGGFAAAATGLMLMKTIMKKV
jgi:CrcB protein